MSEFIMRIAKRIPSGIRKNILEEKFIERSVNSDVTGTPFQYLFDVYEHFLDAAGEHDDWNCIKCRAYILEQWRTLLPYLEELQHENAEHNHASE